MSASDRCFLAILFIGHKGVPMEFWAITGVAVMLILLLCLDFAEKKSGGR